MKKIPKFFLVIVLFFPIFQIHAQGLYDKFVTLKFASNTLQVNPNENISIPINLDTLNRNVQAMDLVIGFDTKGMILTSVILPSHSFWKTLAPLNQNNVFDEARVLTQANETGFIRIGVFPDIAAPSTFMGIVAPFVVLQFTAKNVEGVFSARILTTYRQYPGNFDDSNAIVSNSTPTVPDDAIDLPMQNLSIIVGNPLTDNSPTPKILKPGDANEDGKVNGIDYIIWLQHYGYLSIYGHLHGDFNEDKSVNGQDYVLWVTKYEF